MNKPTSPQLEIPFDTRLIAHLDRLPTAEWASWPVTEAGFLRGGMGNTSKTGTNQQHRERLWLSPHCLTETTEPDNGQLDLWGDDDE